FRSEARFDKPLGVLQSFRRQFLAGQHAADLADAAGAVQLLDRRHRTAASLALFDEIMVIREAGDLRQVSHAEHLVGGSELLETASDSLGGASTDAGVD